MRRKRTAFPTTFQCPIGRIFELLPVVDGTIVTLDEIIQLVWTEFVMLYRIGRIDNCLRHCESLSCLASRACINWRHVTGPISSDHITTKWLPLIKSFGITISNISTEKRKPAIYTGFTSYSPHSGQSFLVAWQANRYPHALHL